MNEQEVIELMETSKSAREWDDNCDKVKAACDGYPEFWWTTMIQSGRGNKIATQWGGSTELTIQSF